MDVNDRPDANTNDELLDLVDADDKVIGEVWKSQANHQPGLIHREVGIFIYDNQDRVLLQQRSLTKPHQPGRWMVAAAGHVPKGMTPLAAAHMELTEELGFDMELRFLEKQRNDIESESRFTYWFIGQYLGQEIKIDPREVAQTKFFTKEEFEVLIKSSALRTNTLEPAVNRFFRGELSY